MDEYRYLEYGSAIHRPIAFDGAAALVSSATHDEPAADTSEIVLDDDYLDGIDLTGKELVVSIPNDPNDAYRVARVVRNTANTLWINDPGTYSAADAIDAGRPFVVYDFEGSAQEAGVNFTVLSVTYLSGPDQTVLECTPYFYAVGWTIEGDLYQAEVVEVDPGVSYVVAGDQTDNFAAMSAYVATPPAHAVTKGAGGEWTGSPTYASSETTFTDSGADFQAYMTGWLLQPDVELPSYLEIVEVDESSGNWVRVKGDADTLATSGSTYRLHAPPGVDRATGALITGLEEAGSQWLWAGYEYVPPMVGFHNPAGQDPGIYGAQSGGNKVGSYHCWNRVYEPATGRWTTPDPAMTPWANLQDYSGAMPTLKSDPSGLVPVWAPCVVGAISSFLIDGVVEWFLDSEYTVCEMIFSAIIGCIAGYAPYIGAAKGLKKQIKDAITELGFGIFMGRICEEVYTPDEESLGLSDFLSDPSLLGRQVKKKAKEVVTAGEDYVKKMGDAAEEDRRRRFREKYPKVEEKKDSKCGARERPYDGGDASAWFDPSKVRAGGKLTYEFCVDSCVKGAGLAYTHVEQRCAKSCEQYK